MLVIVCLFSLSFVTTTWAEPPVGINLAAMQGWDVVVADDAIPSERHAAEEFQQFFAQAAGINLPIVTQVNRANHHVFIGPSETLRSSKIGFEVNNFGEEDLRIVIRDGNIAIAGGRPRGTLYGVYTFLEDYLGIRYFTFDHTHIPPVGDWRVVGPIDRFYHPPLGFRWAAYGELSKYPTLAARLRCNTVTDQVRFLKPNQRASFNPLKLGGTTNDTLINHSFHSQLLVERHGADHPEYYGLERDKRISSFYHFQPCLTNPEVGQVVAQSLLTHMQKHPQQTNISVAQPDGEDNYCRCSSCATVDMREGVPMGTMLTFVNAVTMRVVKKHPKLRVGTLAYIHTRIPPKYVKPHPNVQIQLCSPRINVLRPMDYPDDELNLAFARNVRKWAAMTNYLSFWVYDASFPTYPLPVPNMRAIEPNIRFIVAHKGIGVFMQGAYNALGGDFSDLRAYLISRLLWDPNLNGQQLMDEFLDLHYGRAATPIRRYINFLHDDAESKGKTRSCMGTEADYKIEDEIIRTGLDAFDEALQLADDDVIRARVEKASIAAYCAAIAEPSFWTWENRNREVSAANNGIGWGAIEKTMPQRLAERRPYFRKFFNLAKTYGVTHWAESVTIEQASTFNKAGYGIGKDEPW